MTAAEAARLLESAEVVPALQAGIAGAKELVASCLANGIPAMLGRDDHCTQGCAPKAFLLVRSEDLQRLQELLARDWHALVASVGETEVSSVGVGIEAGEGEEPPCPACGTVGPLADGACRECGLQLA
jgi:hypothetical protein